MCVDFVDDFFCNCLIGFVGEFCVNEINECFSSLCLNGNCIDFVGVYLCFCLLGWEGVNCEFDIDECMYENCLINGNCENL